MRFTPGVAPLFETATSARRLGDVHRNTTLDIDCAHALAFTIVSLATPLIGQIDDIPRHRRLSMTTCRSQTPRRSRVHPCFGFLASGASMILWLAWNDLFDTCRLYFPCQSSNRNTRGTGDISIGSIGSIGRACARVDAGALGVSVQASTCYLAAVKQWWWWWWWWCDWGCNSDVMNPELLWLVAQASDRQLLGEVGGTLEYGRVNTRWSSTMIDDCSLHLTSTASTVSSAGSTTPRSGGNARRR